MEPISVNVLVIIVTTLNYVSDLIETIVATFFPPLYSIDDGLLNVNYFYLISWEHLGIAKTD